VSKTKTTAPVASPFDVTEPDRFIPHIPTKLPPGAINTTGADWQKVRACFVAAGFDWSVADNVMRAAEKAGGRWALSASAAITPAIVGNAISPEGAAPYTTLVTTSVPHGLRPGDTTTVAGMSGGTPTLNGARTVGTVPSPTTFTVGLQVTVAGTGGTLTLPADTTRRIIARGLVFAAGKQSSRAKYVVDAFGTLAAATPIRWTTLPTMPRYQNPPK